MVKSVVLFVGCLEVNLLLFPSASPQVLPIELLLVFTVAFRGFLIIVVVVVVSGDDVSRTAGVLLIGVVVVGVVRVVAVGFVVVLVLLLGVKVDRANQRAVQF